MTLRNKIKVLQIAPSLGGHGGIEAFNITIANSLTNSSDVDVSILYRLRRGAKITDDFKAITQDKPYSIRIFRKNLLTVFITIFQNDVIHCHYPFWWALLPSILLRKPILLTVHNKLPPKNQFILWIEKHLLMRASKVLFNSQFTASTWGVKCDGPRRSVVPSPTEFQGHHTTPSERRGFAALSRLVPGKGIPELIAAYQAADINHHEHPLFIMGMGPLMDELKKAISPDRLNDIILYGYVPESAKAKILSKALWNVASQTFPEDLGLSPIEAGLCGVPSIASNIGGLPEASGPGALLVPPGDVPALKQALERALTMPPKEYSQRCLANLKYLEKYLMPVSKYQEIYKALYVMSGARE
jgi:glycosyltransferase involved in cell wall biosynthesis